MEPAHKEEKEADAKAKLGEAEQAQDNDGPQHEEGEEAEEVQEVEEGQQPTEEQQREQLKADIQAHNVNVTFTKYVCLPNKRRPGTGCHPPTPPTLPTLGSTWTTRPCCGAFGSGPG